MVRADVISLVAESPEAHGVFDTPTETSRTVFAEVRSVTMSEFYRAASSGIEPAMVFRLTNYADYKGEKIVVWNSTRYRVVRTYVNGDGIDITVEVATNDR